jgi:hypothetical protein
LGSAREGHWIGREAKRSAGLRKACEAAAAANRAAAQDAYADLVPLCQQRHAEGRSLQAIADELNRQGHTSRRGGQFTAMQVLRILRRAGQHTGETRT